MRKQISRDYFQLSAARANKLIQSGKITDRNIKAKQDIGIPYNRKLDLMAVLVLVVCGIDTELLHVAWPAMWLVKGARLKLNIRPTGRGYLIDPKTNRPCYVFVERMKQWLVSPADSISSYRPENIALYHPTMSILGSGANTKFVKNEMAYVNNPVSSDELVPQTGVLDETWHREFAVIGVSSLPDPAAAYQAEVAELKAAIEENEKKSDMKLQSLREDLSSTIHDRDQAFKVLFSKIYDTLEKISGQSLCKPKLEPGEGEAFSMASLPLYSSPVSESSGAQTLATAQSVGHKHPRDDSPSSAVAAANTKRTCRSGSVRPSGSGN